MTALIVFAMSATSEAQGKGRGKHRKHPAPADSSTPPDSGTDPTSVDPPAKTPSKKGPRKSPTGKGAKMPAGKKAAGKKKGDKDPSAKSAPAKSPKVSLAPTVTGDPKEKEKPKLVWKRVARGLTKEYFVRHPEATFERAWPGSDEADLGTFGAGATLRWRRALARAQAELEQLDTKGLDELAAGQVQVLRDWIEAELLLLDVESPSTSDPAGYVQRAFRTLRTARDAEWMPVEKRQATLAGLLQELPDYFDDARTGLVDPAAQWIDLALLDLDDLEELVVEIQRGLVVDPAAKPKKTKKAAGAGAPPADPHAAVEDFRAWLLELRSSAGGQPPRLDAGEWERLVALRTGTTWSVGEIKARCLRELGWLDLAARESHASSPLAAGDEDLVQQAWSASTQALELGRNAHLLGKKIAPGAVEFAFETSPRTSPQLAWLCSSGTSSMRVLLARPHGSWPTERTITQERGLEDARSVLGIRYGLAGEALFALQSRASRVAPPMLLDNRLVREGLGLFALDWAGRVDWTENPFREDAELASESEFQRGLEAARLVAALELHAQGVTLQEAARGFQRRTGVDADTARAEALAALRDPEHGLAYLGLIELRDLEEHLAHLTKPRKGLKLTLLLALRNPELRPADMASSAGRASPPAEKKKPEKTTPALEKTAGQPQQEHPGSR